jgi:hypothetical protein
VKRTTLVAVPVTVGGQTFTVTYRVTVVLGAGDRNQAVWGYAEAVSVRVSAERQFDITIDQNET